MNRKDYDNPNDCQRPGETRLRWAEKIMLSRWFRAAAQGLLLVLFVGLVVMGWQVYAPQGVESKLFAKTNLVTLLVWGLWWPSMVFAAVLLGRVWCAICPLEMVSRWGERFAAAMRITPAVPGRWLRGGWMILLFFAVIQMMIPIAELHRTPMFTSIYLLAMLLLAVVFGMIYRDRAYCRMLCPVGLLLKVYGRGGAIAVRPDRPDHRIDPALSRSCASKLNPLRLDKTGGDECLLCGDCVRADAAPQRRMGIYLRRPWSVLAGPKALPSLSVTLFIMMASGFVTSQVCTLWKPAQSIFLVPPKSAASVLGMPDLESWMRALWMLGVFPLLLWSLLALPLLWTKQADGWITAWRRLAYPVSLVVIAGHLAKGAEKLASWATFLPGTLRDPEGAETATRITGGALSDPGSLLPPLAIYAAGLLFLVLAVRVICREAAARASTATHHP